MKTEKRGGKAEENSEVLVSHHPSVEKKASQDPEAYQEGEKGRGGVLLRKNLPSGGGLSHQHVWHTVSGPSGL